MQKGPNLSVMERRSANIHKSVSLRHVIQEATAPPHFQIDGCLNDLCWFLYFTQLEWVTLIDKEDNINERDFSTGDGTVIKTMVVRKLFLWRKEGRKEGRRERRSEGRKEVKGKEEMEGERKEEKQLPSFTIILEKGLT